MSSENRDIFFDGLIKKFEAKNGSSSGNDNTETSNYEDLDFEKNLRNILKENLPVSILQLENLDINKEFELYKLEIYNRQTKELIKTETFKKGFNYYYLQIDKEYFFIPSNNLSILYYFDSGTQKTKKILGFKENHQLYNDSTKYFLENMEKNFYSDIKFNLISKKTISFIGENNNIPEKIFDYYYGKTKLLSKGNNQNFICLEKNKEFTPGSGNIHYPIEKYYLKLNLLKCQFDSIFISEKEIELKTFECDVIYSNFTKIEKKSKILFEFINGDSDENKVISQADNYQLIAKTLFKEEPFYHIIIVRSKKLGNLLKGKIRKIKKKNYTNFAILCLNNNLKILGIDFTSKKEELKESSKQSKYSKKSKSKSSQSDLEIGKKNVNKLSEEIVNLRNEFLRFKKLMIILIILSIILKKINLLF